LVSFDQLQADVDNSGTIDYIEFIAATLHLNKLEREEHLVAAFSYFDKDGSGYITVDELQQACKEHNMPDAFLDDVITEADQDNVSKFMLVVGFSELFILNISCTCANTLWMSIISWEMVISRVVHKQFFLSKRSCMQTMKM
jgi:hypothetical protein